MKADLKLITLHDGREGVRRTLQVEASEPADANGEPELDFIASTDSLDHHGESIDQTGWDYSVFKKNPVIVNCHQYHDITFILGRAVSFGVRDNRLQDRVRFSVQNPFGLLAYKMAKANELPAQSVGFVADKVEDGLINGRPARIFRRQTLLEISFVVIPANPDASTLALSKAMTEGAVNKSDLEAVVGLLSKLCEEHRTPAPDRAAGGDSQPARASLADKLRRTALEIQLMHATHLFRRA